MMARRVKRIKGLFTTMVIVSIPLFFVQYFINGGSSGPVGYIILIAVAFFLFIQRPKYRVAFIIYTVISVVLGGVIEYNYPELVIGYTSHKQQVLDHIYTLILTILILVYIISYVREHYNKEKKGALAAEKLKSSFLTNMSHEIRTPLNAIVGYSQLLADDDYSKQEKEEQLDVVRDNAHILLNLIDDVLEMTRIEAGSIEIHNDQINVYEVMDGLYSKFSENFKLKNNSRITFTGNYDESAKEILIESDIIRVKQILSNVLNNAIKFTEHGNIIFGYSLNKKKSIEFHIIDSGIGIPEEEMDFIFEKFKKQQLRLDKHRLGAGLGLAISKNLVDMLQGRIEIESEEGQGTEVRIILPVKPKKV